jgi:hypothetical protein
MSDTDKITGTTAADIHDKAVIQSALAVLGGTRRHFSKVADAAEALNKLLEEIQERINAR